MKHTVCLAAAAKRMQLGSSLADSFAQKIHLPYTMAGNTSQQPSDVPK
jgi:hypothetical protein